MGRGRTKDDALTAAAKLLASKRHGTKTRAAQTLGSKGGERGGPARAETLTKQQRIDIARKGGKALAKKKERE